MSMLFFIVRNSESSDSQLDEGYITDEDKIGYQMAQILNVPDNFELVCFLPIGIAETEPTLPKKRTFEERAWFNAFPDIQREF